MPRKKRLEQRGRDERYDVAVMLDLGNAYLKWCAADPNTLQPVSWGAVPHSFAYLDEIKLQYALQIYRSSERAKDFLMFENICCAIGEQAQMYQQEYQPRIGAQRFQRDYYVPLFLRVMSSVMDDLGRDELTVMLRVSFAVVDADYMYKQLDLLKDEFVFWVADGRGGLKERRVAVVIARPYNETHGGYCAAAFEVNLDARTFTNRLFGCPQIVIDVGGSTVTGIKVDGEGEAALNPRATYSEAGVGVLAAAKGLISLIRLDEQLGDILRVTSVPEHEMLNVLRTGQLVSLGVVYDVREFVARALSPILMRVDAAIMHLSRGLGAAGCIVTGGGGALIAPYLAQRYPSFPLQVAYPQAPHMGNVIGAYKAHCVFQLDKDAI